MRSDRVHGHGRQGNTMHTRFEQVSWSVCAEESHRLHNRGNVVVLKGSAEALTITSPLSEFVWDVLEICDDSVGRMKVSNDRKDETLRSDQIVPVPEGTHHKFPLRAPFLNHHIWRYD